MRVIPISSPSFSFSFAYASLEWLACKQALHFGAIVKSRRARGTRPSRFASLAQIGERVRTLEDDEERRNENARWIVGRESENRGSLHFLTEFLLRFAPLARTIFQLFLHVFYVWTSQWEPLRRRKESISPCVCSGRAMSTQVWDNHISSFLQYSECPLRLA